MKTRSNYILTEIADEYVAVSVGDVSKHIIRLNQTGADIFRWIQEGHNKEQIAIMLMETYNGVDKDGAMVLFKRLSKR